MTTTTTETQTTVKRWNDVGALRNAVRTLNKQHMQHGAGFYYEKGGRFFRAREAAGVLEVSDFETWTAVGEADAKFHDHNGRDISLLGGVAKWKIELARAIATTIDRARREGTTGMGMTTLIGATRIPAGGPVGTNAGWMLKNEWFPDAIETLPASYRSFVIKEGA